MKGKRNGARSGGLLKIKGGSKMKKRYYIAYGSNLNVEQMRLRCPDAAIVGTAILKGYELVFKGSKTGSYLTIEESEGGEVPVAVWAVSAADEKRLDLYEGYPQFYYKLEDIPLTVKHPEMGWTKKVKAFVYVMDESRTYGVPSSYYMRVCHEGYKHFGFELGYLIEAYRKSERRTA